MALSKNRKNCEKPLSQHKKKLKKKREKRKKEKLQKTAGALWSASKNYKMQTLRKISATKKKMRKNGLKYFGALNKTQRIARNGLGHYQKKQKLYYPQLVERVSGKNSLDPKLVVQVGQLQQAT